MIAVSKELKQACDSESLSYKEYIVIDGTTVEIKGKMSNTAYKNTTFFGTFNLKMLEFTTENDIDYKKKIFTYWKSVNGEAFKIGSYIVTDVNDNDSTEEVTVTAMDYGLKFAIPYTTSLNYASGTITLYDVLEECCTNAGVELENLTIANGDFIVDGNQFVNGEQVGTVVANIAGICGDFATINENDKLELIFYKKTETIDNVNLTTEDGFNLLTEDGAYLIVVDDMEEIDDYISLDDKRDTQPITCMSLGFSNIDGEEIIRKDDDLIALYGENWLRIDDNYFAYSTAKMDLLIDNIFNKVKGFGYSSFVSKYSFKPYLQLGDMIYFKNKNGDKIRSVVFKIDTDYDDITLSAPSITKATVDYERPDDALTVAKNAQISVDKANAQIELRVTYNDFGTTLIQNSESLQISWNQISQKIQFATDGANASLQILDDSNYKLMQLDKTGMSFYYQNSLAGYMGTELVTNIDSGDQFNCATTRIMYDGAIQWQAQRWGYPEYFDSILTFFNTETNQTLFTDVKFLCKDGLEVYGELTVNGPSNVPLSYPVGSIEKVEWIGGTTAGRLYADITSGGTVILVGTYSSDARLKKNIYNSEIKATDVINKIQHREFDFKADNVHKDLGYIAQELEEVIPEAVINVEQYDELMNVIDNIKQIDNSKIIPYLTKAFQEQNIIIEELCKKLNIKIDKKKEKREEIIYNLGDVIMSKPRQQIKKEINYGK